MIPEADLSETLMLLEVQERELDELEDDLEALRIVLLADARLQESTPVDDLVIVHRPRGALKF